MEYEKLSTIKKQLLKDKEIKKVYDKLKPEFELIQIMLKKTNNFI